MTELQQLHQQYPRLTHTQANRLVQLHHQQKTPHAYLDRIYCLSPAVVLRRTSDRPDGHELEGMG